MSNIRLQSPLIFAIIMCMIARKKNLQTSSKSAQKERRVKPELPGGFRDYGPAEAIARAQMIETIRKTFESFGFDPLETSSVQRTEVLTGGEEDSGKIIFNVKGSEEETSDNSLRFDLTVPLARFIAANPNIPKPFKRYQIGMVWRGERPQAGRYREFMQADVDIVGSSSIDADAEIVAVLYTTLKNIGIENFVINYNNRRILNLLPHFAGFPEGRLWDILRIVDKADKIGIEKVTQEIRKEFNKEIAEKIKQFIFESAVNDGQSEIMDDYKKIRGRISDKFFIQNRSLVRGLSYYTGSVFEVILTDAPEIGSVGGGGRYDNLIAQFTGQLIPAVGVSIGVDRLFAALEKRNKLGNTQTKTSVLVIEFDDRFKRDYLDMIEELREAGINTTIYLGDDETFQAQFSYAIKKGIPFVVFYGEEEKKKGVVAVKNLATRKQEEVKRERLVDFFKK